MTHEEAKKAILEREGMQAKRYKLVPLEPTEEMKNAYAEASIAPIGPISVYGYRAMIDAAPEAPEPAEVQPVAF